MDQDKIKEEISDLRNEINRQARLLRWSIAGWLGVICFAVLGASWQSGAPFFPEVRVGRLALVDANGVERLILDADNRVVHLKGKNLKRGPQISGIILQNEKGDEVGGMGTSNCNGLDMKCPSMTAVMLDGYSNFTDSGGTERVGLFSREDGTAGLVLVDLKDKVRSLFVSDPDLNVSLSLSGGNQKSQIAGKVASDGSAEWTGPQSK